MFEELRRVCGCGGRELLRRHILRWKPSFDSHWFGIASGP